MNENKNNDTKDNNYQRTTIETYTKDAQKFIETYETYTYLKTTETIS